MTTATFDATVAGVREHIEQLGKLWQEGVGQTLDAYRAQWGQAAEANAAFWDQLLPPESAQRTISERLCAVARANSDLAGAVLAAPVAALPPETVAERYLALIDANRNLLLAYVDLLNRWQEAQAAITGEMIEATRRALEGQRTALRTMEEVNEEFATEAAEVATASLAGEEAHIAAEAIATALAEAEPVPGPMASPGLLIKGNISRAGEKIYHVPGQANYDRVFADAVFHSEAEAEAAGYRAARR